jgi:hypothetical protein
MFIYILKVDKFIAVLNILFICILFRLPTNLIQFFKNNYVSIVNSG